MYGLANLLLSSRETQTQIPCSLKTHIRTCCFFQELTIKPSFLHACNANKRQTLLLSMSLCLLWVIKIARVEFYMKVRKASVFCEITDWQRGLPTHRSHCNLELILELISTALQFIQLFMDSHCLLPSPLPLVLAVCKNPDPHKYLLLKIMTLSPSGKDIHHQMYTATPTLVFGDFYTTGMLFALFFLITKFLFGLIAIVILNIAIPFFFQFG